MCVVDTMRFPYIEGTGTTITQRHGQLGNYRSPRRAAIYNTIYSAQRLPALSRRTRRRRSDATRHRHATQPPDPRYGYTEQIAVPRQSTVTDHSLGSGPQGYLLRRHRRYARHHYHATNYDVSHAWGIANDSDENWDYFLFNDRDFTSVAELMLVPGCPPGLFTKQFAEFAPGGNLLRTLRRPAACGSLHRALPRSTSPCRNRLPTSVANRQPRRSPRRPRSRPRPIASYRPWPVR